MKNRSQWFSFAALCTVGACLLGCPHGQPGAQQGAQQSATNDAATEQLYDTNCSVCHGKALEGRPTFAPALTDLKSNWKSSDELAKYLADPQGYAAADPRLKSQHDNYSMRMPALPFTDEQRKALALWLLKQ